MEVKKMYEKGPTLDTYKSYHFYKYNKEHNILNEHNIQTNNTLLASLLKYKKDTKKQPEHTITVTWIQRPSNIHNAIRLKKQHARAQKTQDEWRKTI
jgi:hypothetical protein